MLSTKKINWWRFILLLLPVLVLLLPASASAASIVTELKTNEGFKGLWQLLLNIIDSFVILLLIIIGFAEILRLKVDTYGVKKVLPTFILALVAAHFSYLFCQFIVDLSNIAITFFANNTVNGNDLQTSFGAGITPIPFKWAHTVPDLTGWKQNWGTFFNVIFIFATGILLVVLWALFIVRTYVIYLLTIASSLAMISLALPFTRTIFTRWWSELLKWVFMPVVSIFFLWLGGIVIQALPNDPLVGIIVAGVCAYLAISIPWGWGLQNVIGNIGGKVAKATGLRWAADKAKTKWFDPAIKEAKDNVTKWWLKRAEGHPSVFRNPLGAIVRRGLRVEERRKDAAKAAELAKDSAQRFALGGKPYIDKRGRKIYPYLSKKARDAIAKRKDLMNSDAGEYDWAIKDLDTEWKKDTPEGQDAIRRTLAYNFRVASTKNNLKALELQARAEAFSQEEGNRFLNDTKFGIVRGDRHWKYQKDSFVESQELLKQAAELVAGKMENDRIKYDFQPAGSLHLLVSEHESLQKALKAAQPNSEEWNKINAKLADVVDRWKRAMDTLTHNPALYKNGQFTSNAITLRKMLTDANGFVGNDITRAKSLSTLWGYDNEPDDLRFLFDSRIRKAISIMEKDEITSEASKRTHYRSADRAVTKWRKQVKEILTGDVAVWTNEHKDAWAAYANGLVGAGEEEAPEIYSKYVDLVGEAIEDTNTTDPGKRRALSILTGSVAQSLRSTLTSQAIMGETLEGVAKEQVGDQRWAALDASERADKIAEIRRTATTEIATALKKRAQQITGEDQLEGLFTKFEFDEYGQLRLDIDANQIDLNTGKEVLSRVIKKSVTSDIRERRNAAGQQRISAIAGWRDSSPTGQEAGSYFEDLVRAGVKAGDD